MEQLVFNEEDAVKIIGYIRQNTTLRVRIKKVEDGNIKGINYVTFDLRYDDNDENFFAYADVLILHDICLMLSHSRPPDESIIKSVQEEIDLLKKNLKLI